MNFVSPRILGCLIPKCVVYSSWPKVFPIIDPPKTISSIHTKIRKRFCVYRVSTKTRQLTATPFLEPQQVHVVRVNRMLPINNTPRRPEVLRRQDRIDLSSNGTQDAPQIKTWHRSFSHSVMPSCVCVCLCVCNPQVSTSANTRTPRTSRTPSTPRTPQTPPTLRTPPALRTPPIPSTNIALENLSFGKAS